ncbi:MAG: hypothetical protein OXG15_03145 [Gammaproteobacteria bacterium]|nr:hypothetical protein [Gammaproteobacteria bacterium]
MTIVAIALIASFVTTQALSGLNSFIDSTFGFDLSEFPSLQALESVPIVFASTLIMWLAVVPLTIQTIESQPQTRVNSSIESAWSLAVAAFRTLNVRILVRTFYYLVVSCAILACSALPVVGGLILGNFTIAMVILALMIPISIWISLKLTLAFPAMVMEDIGVFSCFRRSWIMSKSQLGRLFVVVAIASVLATLCTVVFYLGLFVPLWLLHDNPGEWMNTLNRAGTFVSQIFTLVLLAPIVSVCYYNLRDSGL